MVFRLKFLFVLMQIYGFVFTQRTLSIGGIFPENSEHLVNAFQNAVRVLNTSNELLKLQAVTVSVDINDSFKVQKAVCELIERDISALFGPNSQKTTGVVSAICKRFKIPHFTLFWQPLDIDNFNSTDSFTRNLFPHPKLFSQAILEIIKSFRWKTLAFIYEESDNLIKMQDVLSTNSGFDMFEKQFAYYYKIPADSTDFKPLLKDISKWGINQVMIDCSLKNTFSILAQSVDVNMHSEYVSYFIVNNDGYTIDLSPIITRANITTIRLMNPSNVDVMNAVYEFHIRNRFRPMSLNQVSTEQALIQDGITVFAKAFGDNVTFIDQFQMSPVACYNTYQYQEPSSSGRDILDKIDQNNVRGMTEDIHFDSDGLRDQFYVEILELTRSNDTFEPYQKVAIYDTQNGMQLFRDFTIFDTQTTQNMQTKTFIVIMHELMPFLRKKPHFVLGENRTMNDMYEGFAMDLLEKIATRCRFKYEIRIEKEYGKENPVTKQWNGIVGEIMNKRADLAIGDITITHARKRAIDFSTPFMTLGISILYAKPHKGKPGLFSFMAPLSINVWLYVATAFLIVSMVEFLLAKMAANDWENPHPCDEDPEELENIWNMHNCMWLTVGSIMQQGCDILPKGVPPRLAAAVWWFFALIVTSSYTANLAAFLTKEQMEESIGGVDDLASQSQIRYGVLAGGSTEAFFRHSNYSTYQKMWAVMEKAEPSVFVSSNDEGVDRVKRSGRMYAFFMESALINYITHKECNLTQIGGLLDAKEYGIGMPINSPYRTTISQAILHLQEDGTIQNLTRKWWETENVDESGNQVDCNAGEKEASDTPELDMDNVGGVFLVLVVGLTIAIVIGILEFIWSVRRVSIEEKITPCEAFKKELMFAVRVWKIRKPIGPPPSERSSLQSNPSIEGKPEMLRLQSVQSGKQNGNVSY